jgi:AsmA protein
LAGEPPITTVLKLVRPLRRLLKVVLALRANVASADAKGEARADASAFAFDLVGQWDNATITPDAPAFIRRSGAARPLLAPSKSE